VKRAAAVLLLAVLLAGCSDDGDSDGDASPTTTTADAPTSAVGSAPSTTAGCQSVEGEQVALAARDFAFEPTCVRVGVDQELNVTNRGDATHNVTVEGGYDQDLEPGTSFTTGDVGGTLQPGTYELVCQFHEARGMKARLEVAPA
jgi:plastocyanin